MQACHAFRLLLVEAAKAEEGKDAEVRNSVSNLKPVPFGGTGGFPKARLEFG